VGTRLTRPLIAVQSIQPFVFVGDYVPGDKTVQEYRNLYKICSTAFLILGILVMVWLLQIFSETPEFNWYKYFTLVEDGQLTHHSMSDNQSANKPDEIDLRKYNNIVSSVSETDQPASFQP
jgi:hypothetical protein